ASFGRNLDAQGYFGRLQSLQSTPGGLTIIVAGDYMGAVIVTRERLPMSDGLASSGEEDRRFPYLDKLAVHPDSQGTGLADILWSSLQRAFPTCVWRSRVANKVNGWYFERATGHWRIPQASGASPYWICFWYQGNDRTVDCQRMLASIIPVVESIPPSFTS
ncbi:Amino-acid acetyltransferase, mitochondrial, partial [Spiromyces aspiralis]